MVPYITALVVFILVILATVYYKIDGFAGGIINESSRMKDVMNYLRFYLNQSKALKEKLDKLPEFDETISSTKKTELGIERPITKPFSKTLSLQLQSDISAAAAMIDSFEKAIASGAMKETKTIKETFPDANVIRRFTEQFPIKDAILAARKVYVVGKENDFNKKTSTPSRDTTNPIKFGGIYDALCGTDKAIQASSVYQDTNLTKPRARQDSVKEKAPSMSPVGSREMEDRIAKSVAKQLKDTMIADRSTQDLNAMPCPYAPYSSSATSQGQELLQTKPAVDMNEYIRKDSIPCWNCSLP